LHSAGRPIYHVELAILADPEVRERVDAQHAVSVCNSTVDDFDQTRGIIGVEFEDIEIKDIGILAGAPALGIDERDRAAQFCC